MNGCRWAVVTCGSIWQSIFFLIFYCKQDLAKLERAEPISASLVARLHPRVRCQKAAEVHSCFTDLNVDKEMKQLNKF